MPSNNDVQAALEAGKVIGAPFQVSKPDLEKGEGGLFHSLPQGYTVHDLERFYPSPRRNRGNTMLLDEASFISFVKMALEGAGEFPPIWATKETPSFQVVFNPGTIEAPDWADIRCSYKPDYSAEWEAWTALEGDKLVSQATFAEFIEEHQRDCRTPAGADMLAVASSLKVSKSTNYVSDIVLSNGQVQFAYEETISTGTKRGDISVPQMITIGIPVFDRGPLYVINLRLRYRIIKEAGNKLAFGIDIMNKEIVLEHAFNAMVSNIESNTGLHCLLGVPPSPRG